MKTNPFTPGTGKARLLDALRAGDVDAYAFAPTQNGGMAFDGLKPIGRLAARVKDLRDAGYVIPDVATPDVGHSIYRLVSEPGTSSSQSPAARREDAQATNTGDGAGLGHPAPVAHSGFDFEADGFGPCGPAWADRRNPHATTAIDDTDDDGAEWWEQAA